MPRYRPLPTAVQITRMTEPRKRPAMPLSATTRRATASPLLDFVRYPMTDASIRSFVSALSNLDDGITIRIAGEIEELSQQDYKGRRVNLKISDGRSTFDTKLDLGVHASAAMEQDELWFDVAHRQEGIWQNMYAHSARALMSGRTCGG